MSESGFAHGSVRSWAARAAFCISSATGHLRGWNRSRAACPAVGIAHGQHAPFGALLWKQSQPHILCIGWEQVHLIEPVLCKRAGGKHKAPKGHMLGLNPRKTTLHSALKRTPFSDMEYSIKAEPFSSHVCSPYRGWRSVIVRQW